MSELFEHQKTGITFLEKKKKAILADEMGLGKTRQAILAAGKMTLVVCPASLKINWKREIEMIYPENTIQVIDSKSDVYAEFDWFIINYDILEKRIEQIEKLIEVGKIKTIVLDEAHYIKGKSIRATVVIGGKVKKKSTGEVRKFEGLANKVENVYCLTGTPLLNRPIELFNLLTAIGHPLGGYGKRSAFARKFCGAFMRQIFARGGRPIWIMDESGSSNLGELRGELDGWILRRKKKEVLDLPEKIISVMETEMSREAKKDYDNAWDNYIEFVKENPMPEQNIDNIILARHLVEIQKLKQVASRWKVNRMVEDIRNATEQGEKVIVFSQYTKTIEMIAEEVRTGNKLNPGIKTVTLTGADDMNERQLAVDSFQNEEDTKVFVGNIKAAGVGLNLTAASIVMFADLDWTPETHRQAEDRAHRIGQGGTVNVYYYVATGTIEEDIIAVLNKKKNVMDQILEGGKNRLGKFSSQEMFLRLMAKKANCG